MKLTSSALTLASMCSGRSAPAITVAICGRDSSQAIDICGSAPAVLLRRTPASFSCTVQLRSLSQVVNVGRMAPRAARLRRDVALVGAAEQPAGEREVGDHAQAVLHAERRHALLDVAVEQVVEVLAGDELASGCACAPSTAPPPPPTRRSWSSRCSAPCPERTRSSSARIVSSIGVLRSGVWIW